MKKIKPDVNFSDRSVRPSDPHQWEQVEAAVVLRGRVLYRPKMYLCVRCGLWSPLLPRIEEDETCRANALPDVRSDPARDMLDEGLCSSNTFV